MRRRTESDRLGRVVFGPAKVISPIALAGLAGFVAWVAVEILRHR